MDNTLVQNIQSKQLVQATEQIHKALASKVLDTLGTVKADIAKTSYFAQV